MDVPECDLNVALDFSLVADAENGLVGEPPPARLCQAGTSAEELGLV
jgi:hypothetical protein